MTTDKYAEQLVADLWQANIATHEERVSIMSAGLRRQREECGVVAMNALGWGHYNPLFHTILNAEVKE